MTQRPYFPNHIDHSPNGDIYDLILNAHSAQLWFAWRPVKVDGEWVWLKRIWRQRYTRFQSNMLIDFCWHYRRTDDPVL